MRSLFAKWRRHKADATSATSAEKFSIIYRSALTAAEAKNDGLAVELYDRSIALDPSQAEPYYKRGNALQNLGRMRDAIQSFNEAIERKPDYAYAYCNRGVAQQSLGHTTEALESYGRALEFDGFDAMTYYNRALLMQDLSRWEDALADYARAVSLAPEFSDAQYNRSLALLLHGDLENGCRGFEWRWKNARRLSIGEPRVFSQPLWLGDAPIAGKRVLLYCEGGLGDTLHFCRYATLLAARNATVLLEVQPPLVGLLAGLSGVSEIYAAGSPLPPFDYQCPLMSLPLACKTTLDTIPATPRYLQADGAKVARWRERLGEHRRPRVGLAWSGNPNNPIDRQRSIPLADWAAMLPRGFDYICLQKDIRPGDAEILSANPTIARFDSCLVEFSDTAALCECLDLIISVDTSVAHLSAGLGRPTWVMLPLNPDWRWLRGRDNNPWYPTVRLFRQRQAGDWNPVLSTVAAALRDQEWIP